MGGMMGPGGMLGHHMERLTQQLQLADQQPAQVRTLLRNHVKEVIRLRADIGILAVDVRQLLDTDAVELPKVKQLLQNMAMKEADLRLAHITLMQEVNKLLTPEQQQKFRPMREHMMGHRGMMGMGGMMGPGGMMGRGHGER
jgi:Spy/CpxP family protein refolding chaperone